jgi:Helix-turn-helix domain of resolvase
MSGTNHPPESSSRANGTKFGRPQKVHDEKDVAAARRMKADGHTAKDIAKYLGVSRATCTGISACIALPEATAADPPAAPGAHRVSGAARRPSDERM